MAFESQAMRDARIDVGAVLGAVVRRLPRIIMVTLLLLAVTFGILMFMPRLYESSASILVEPRTNVFSAATNAQPGLSGGEAGVVSSQIELIKSRDTLLNVIDQLDLRSVAEFNGSGVGPSPLALISQLLGRRPAQASVDEVVLGNLFERMTVIQERDSRLISVLVRSTDPQLAADIANAVANAHVTRRAQLSLSDTAEASSWLREEIDKLRVSVTEAETAVANFKVDNDLFLGSNNTSLADQQLSTIATQISAAQERKNTALSRSQLIRGLIERGQSIEGVPDVRESAVIQRLSEEKARLQGERAQQAATLLPSHPTIQALAAQIAELDNQISLEGRSVADALDAEAQIEAALEVSLRQDLDGAKGSASTATQDTVTLDGLEREAKAQRDLLEGYLQRYTEAMSRTDSNSALPDVRVVTLAAPSVTPASPKTQLILLAVGMVAAAAQIGLIVFGELMSGRAMIMSRHGDDEPPRPQDELDTVPFVEDELEPDQRWEGAADEVAVAEPAPKVEAEAWTEAPPVFAEAPDSSDVLVPVVEAEPEWETPVEPEPARTPDVRQNFLELLRQAAAPEPVQPVEEPVEDDFMPVLEPELAFEHEPEVEVVPDVEVVPEVAMEPDFAEPVAEIEDVEELPLYAEPEPALAMATRGHTVPTALADLAADLALGRARFVILTGQRSNEDCEIVAETLAADALEKGLSVALVDAGSRIPSQELGLSDLSTDSASFGDVVHKSTDNSFAEVPWGQGRAIAPHSTKPLTLIEALGDIYEVVILLTGKVGMASTLPLFAHLGGRLVLVAGDGSDLGELDELRAELDQAGLGRAEIVAARELVAA